MAVVSMEDEYIDVVKVVMETGLSLTFQSEVSVFHNSVTFIEGQMTSSH